MNPVFVMVTAFADEAGEFALRGKRTRQIVVTVGERVTHEGIAADERPNSMGEKLLVVPVGALALPRSDFTRHVFDASSEPAEAGAKNRSSVIRMVAHRVKASSASDPVIDCPAFAIVETTVGVAHDPASDAPIVGDQKSPERTGAPLAARHRHDVGMQVVQLAGDWRWDAVVDVEADDPSGIEVLGEFRVLYGARDVLGLGAPQAIGDDSGRCGTFRTKPKFAPATANDLTHGRGMHSPLNRTPDRCRWTDRKS